MTGGFGSRSIFWILPLFRSSTKRTPCAGPFPSRMAVEDVTVAWFFSFCLSTPAPEVSSTGLAIGFQIMFRAAILALLREREAYALMRWRQRAARVWRSETHVSALLSAHVRVNSRSEQPYYERLGRLVTGRARIFI